MNARFLCISTLEATGLLVPSAGQQQAWSDDHGELPGSRLCAVWSQLQELQRSPMFPQRPTQVSASKTAGKLVSLLRFLSWTLICCLKFQNFSYSGNCLRSSSSFSPNPTNCQDSAGPSFPATCSQATAWLIGCPELAKALGKFFLVLNSPHQGSLQYPFH